MKGQINLYDNMRDTVRLAKNHYRHLEKYSYDVGEYNFVKEFESLYETNKLSELHKLQDVSEGKENDSSTIL